MPQRGEVRAPLEHALPAVLTATGLPHTPAPRSLPLVTHLCGVVPRALSGMAETSYRENSKGIE